MLSTIRRRFLVQLRRALEQARMQVKTSPGHFAAVGGAAAAGSRDTTPCSRGRGHHQRAEALSRKNCRTHAEHARCRARLVGRRRGDDDRSASRRLPEMRTTCATVDCFGRSRSDADDAGVFGFRWRRWRRRFSCRRSPISARAGRADRHHRIYRLQTGLHGSFTDCRSTTPGARRSMGENWFVPAGLCRQSAGRARRDASGVLLADGTEMMRPVRLMGSRLLISLNSPRQCADAPSSDSARCQHAVREPRPAGPSRCPRSTGRCRRRRYAASATSTSTAKRRFVPDDLGDLQL